MVIGTPVTLNVAPQLLRRLELSRNRRHACYAATLTLPQESSLKPNGCEGQSSVHTCTSTCCSLQP
eukprot:6750473-Lingulodinium_polyedra.AAC.1